MTPARTVLPPPRPMDQAADPQPRTSLWRLLPILMMPVLSVFVGPALVIASATPVPGKPTLVIAGWGQDTEDMILAAGGEVMGPWRAPLGTFANSDNPDFAEALRAAGAWAVLDAAPIALLCGVEG